MSRQEGFEQGRSDHDPASKPASRSKIHYLGDKFASNAACGRTIITYLDNQPAYTPDVEDVTCERCRSAMG